MLRVGMHYIVVVVIIFAIFMSACSSHRSNTARYEQDILAQKERAYNHQNLPIETTEQQRNTFNYFYIGDVDTTEQQARNHCLEAAQKKALMFSNSGSMNTVVTQQNVEYIKNIITVNCQVKVLRVSAARP